MDKVKKEDVAAFLLEEGFDLTALEFYQELLENGVEMPLLRKKFITDAQTLNQYEQLQPPSADALLKEKDDKLNALDYELKISKETIQSLREQLSKAVNKSKRVIIPPDKKKATGDSEEMEHEIRALNFLYLMQQSYKLSAITLEEEVSDQDLSDWSDVGINTSEPPGLVAFYRYFYNFGPNKDNRAMGEHNRLHKKVTDLEEKNEKLQAEKQDLEQKLQTLQKRIENNETEKPKEDKPKETQPAPVTAATPQQPVASKEPSKPDTKSRLILRRTFAEIAKEQEDTREEDNESFVRITRQLFNIAKLETMDSQLAVRIFGDCLPYIVKGVILKKREELLPVILCVISQHPDSSVRYKLTQLLFNLIKKPNEYDRKIIVAGITALANIISEERIETEVLAQCWEEVSNKHSERRSLIAYACGSLAPYVRPELRPSLFLSILGQLVDDKNPEVREAVSRNLALLVSIFQTNEKFAQIEEMTFKLLFDDEHTVRATTQRLLLPLFAEWANALGVFSSTVMNKILSEMESVITKPEYSQKKHSIAEHDIHRLVLLFTCFKQLLPRFREIILLSAPFTSVVIDIHHFTGLNEQTEKSLQNKFDEFIKSEDPSTLGSKAWPDLEFLVNTALSTIISLITKVGTTNTTIVQGFIGIVSDLCTVFGNTFASVVIKQRFNQQLEKDQVTQTRILPVYLVGVLTALKDKGLIQHLKELILKISLEEAGFKREQIPVLQDSVRMICKIPQRKPEILDLLWDLVVHPTFHVRACVVSLFNGIVNILSGDEVAKRVIPALVTLGGDPEKLVRSTSIQAFGTVALSFTDDAQILDKVGMQLSSYLEDDQHNTRVEITKVFTSIVPQINAKFRDHVILPKLYDIAVRNNKHNNASDREQLARLLFEAFRTYSSCILDDESIEGYLIPGLQQIKKTADQVEGVFKVTVAQLIADMENALRHDDKSGTPNKSKGWYDMMKPMTSMSQAAMQTTSMMFGHAVTATTGAKKTPSGDKTAPDTRH